VISVLPFYFIYFVLGLLWLICKYTAVWSLGYVFFDARVWQVKYSMYSMRAYRIFFFWSLYAFPLNGALGYEADHIEYYL